MARERTQHVIRVVISQGFNRIRKTAKREAKTWLPTTVVLLTKGSKQCSLTSLPRVKPNHPLYSSGRRPSFSWATVCCTKARWRAARSETGRRSRCQVKLSYYCNDFYDCCFAIAEETVKSLVDKCWG